MQQDSLLWARNCPAPPPPHLAALLLSCPRACVPVTTPPRLKMDHSWLWLAGAFPPFVFKSNFSPCPDRLTSAAQLKPSQLPLWTPMVHPPEVCLPPCPHPTPPPTPSIASQKNLMEKMDVTPPLRQSCVQSLPQAQAGTQSCSALLRGQGTGRGLELRWGTMVCSVAR